MTNIRNSNEQRFVVWYWSVWGSFVSFEWIIRKSHHFGKPTKCATPNTLQAPQTLWRRVHWNANWHTPAPNFLTQAYPHIHAISSYNKTNEAIILNKVDSKVGIYRFAGTQCRAYTFLFATMGSMMTGRFIYHFHFVSPNFHLHGEKWRIYITHHIYFYHKSGRKHYCNH